jgi:hypothetical protein
MTTHRRQLLGDDPGTAPHGQGLLIGDETGDRNDGEQTAQGGRQDLGNRGTSETGMVSVSSVWADESG